MCFVGKGRTKANVGLTRGDDGNRKDLIFCSHPRLLFSPRMLFFVLVDDDGGRVNRPSLSFLTSISPSLCPPTKMSCFLIGSHSHKHTLKTSV